MVKITESGSQRNGIGGECFFYCQIAWKDDSGKKREGIATLTVDCDDKGEHPEKFNGSCRVVTPDNLDDHWRGDQFEVEIRTMHKSWYN